MVTDHIALNARDILAEGSLETYENRMEAFHLQLVRLNANIFIVEHVADFPADLLMAPEDTIFLRLVVANFMESSVLVVTRLAGDTDSDFDTLSQFRNWVLRNARSEHRALVRARLKLSRFEPKAQEMLSRAKQLRDTRIAHLKILGPASEFAQNTKLGLSGLRTLRNGLNEQLDALSFGTEHMMLPLSYDQRVLLPVGTDERSDIEKILDYIAEKSPLLHMAEREPAMWPLQRTHLGERAIAALNKCRARLGLPAA
jgi:hypothetical protein